MIIKKLTITITKMILITRISLIGPNIAPQTWKSIDQVSSEVTDRF